MWSLSGLLFGAVCLATPDAECPGARQSQPASIDVPHLRCPIVIDGQLDEPCYERAAHVTGFVVASRPEDVAPRTQAWMMWNADGMVFAFDAEDGDLRAGPAGGNERDVDGQDRVEVFLWSGRSDEAYACIEIGARGAVHDYLARFYRKFDSSWSPVGWSHVVTESPSGYRVEGLLSAAALERLGFPLKAGTRWRLGLFRADFSAASPERPPTWVTWVDAGTVQADFHVAEAFGQMVLR